MCGRGYRSIPSLIPGNVDQSGQARAVAPSFPKLLDPFLVVPMGPVVRSKVLEEFVKPEVDLPELLPELLIRSYFVAAILNTSPPPFGFSLGA